MQVRTLAMIVLYNLAVQRRFRRVLKEADLLSVLSPLLTRSGLIMLLATVASMHLIGGESKHPLLIFNDRQVHWLLFLPTQFRMASDNHEDEFASIQSVISLVACFRPTTFPNGALFQVEMYRTGR